VELFIEINTRLLKPRLLLLLLLLVQKMV